MTQKPVKPVQNSEFFSM